MIKQVMLAVLLSGGTSGSTVSHDIKPVKKMMASKVIEATDKTLEKEATTDGVVLVYFYAPWCSWCDLMNPVVEEIAFDYPQVKVVKLDADKYPEAGVGVFPSFALVVKGKPVWGYRGACTKGNLIEAFKPYLKK